MLSRPATLQTFSRRFSTALPPYQGNGVLGIMRESYTKWYVSINVQ